MMAKVMKVVGSVRQMLSVFSTRAMMKEIMKKYGKEVQTASLKSIYPFITQVSSAAETLHLKT